MGKKRLAQLMKQRDKLNKEIIKEQQKIINKDLLKTDRNTKGAVDRSKAGEITPQKSEATEASGT